MVGWRRGWPGAALSQVSPRETGSAAGLLDAVQQLGATLGVAALGAVFLHGLDQRGADTTDTAGAATTATEHTFWTALVLTALATVAALAMTAPTRSRH
jgi:hypothetical protein